MFRRLSLLTSVLFLLGGIPVEGWAQTKAPAKAPAKTPAKAPAKAPAQTPAQTQAPAAQVQQEKPPAPAPPAGPPLEVRATLVPDTYSMGNVSSPSWEVTLTIKNNTAKELELGESLVVLEKVRESSQFAASYVGRERAQPVPHLKRMKLRYALDFGYDVDSKGTYIMIFAAGGRFAATVGTTDPYPHLGYGRVAPRSERTIEVELPFPVSAKAGMREYVAVITPSIRPVTAPASSTTRMILRFEPAEGGSGKELQPTRTETVTMSEASLRALASDSNAELWRRIFALNWLAEMYPEAAAPLLAQFVADRNLQPLLRLIATVNLGTWQMKEGVPPLLAALQETDNVDVRRWTIDALGDIGDAAAAPAVRGYLTDAEARVASAAMESAGELKDAESVPILLGILNDDKLSDRHDGAADTLAAIGNQEAVAGLISFLRSDNSSQRERAAKKLGKTGSPDAVAPLVAVVENAKTPQDLRGSALASLGQIGNAEAIAALRQAAEGKDQKIRDAAVSALGDCKEPAAVALLIELAEKPDYPARAKAVEVLGQKEKSEALPTLRKLVADSQAPGDVRKEACNALERMKDSQGVSALVAAADDSSASAEVRRAALSALGKIGGNDALAALSRAAEDTNEDVRGTALSALGDFQPIAVTRLVELIGKPGYPSRVQAIRTLRWKPTTEELPALRKIVADPQAPSEVRREACEGMQYKKDKQGVVALLTAATDEDENLYLDALDALAAIGGAEASQARLAALDSRHASVRARAAGQISGDKDAKILDRLWPAYQRETDESAGRNMANALIELEFRDRGALGFLIERLNPAKNKLWFEDVRLLRQISGQEFGPSYAWVNEKERDQELAKWREWWARQPQ